MYKYLLPLSCLAALSYTTFATAGANNNPVELNNNKLSDQYIVIFKSDTNEALINTSVDEINRINNQTQNQSQSQNIKPITRFNRLKGFAATINPKQLALLKKNPQIKSIEANRVIRLADFSVASVSHAITTDAWGIDRLDQAQLPLDGSYAPAGYGSDVHAYVIDSGIRTTHNEFSGRASWAFTASNISEGNDDGNGHGTHMAGTIGGLTYGVASDVNLHAVKVLDSNGQGTLAGLIEGIEYVTNHHQAPAVAAIGMNIGYSATLNAAIATSIAAGVTYAIPAGDDELKDKCSNFTGIGNQALIVAASTSNDEASMYTNRGDCVDIYAPGLKIKSAWHLFDYGNNTISHSPLSAAHVAGAAAVIRGLDSSCDVEQVKAKLIQYSHSGVLANVPNDTSNLLLGVPTTADGEVSCASTGWLSFFQSHGQLLALTDINQWYDSGASANLSNINLNDEDFPQYTFNTNAIGGFQFALNGPTHIDFMQGVSTVGERLHLSGDSLNSLNGLSNLSRVEDDLIFGNSLITSLDGLDSLTYIGKGLRLSYIRNLSDISALSNLRSIGSQNSRTDYTISISGNNKLKNLDGLENITSLNGSVSLYNNALENVDGLRNLTYVENVFLLGSHSQLTNVDGLGKLTEVGGHFNIASNHNLTNVNGLNALTSVGRLDIDSNSGLVDISGISNVSQTGSINGFYCDPPSQYTVKPPLGSPFCNAVAAGEIRVRYRFNDVYYDATVAEICQ